MKKTLSIIAVVIVIILIFLTRGGTKASVSIGAVLPVTGWGAYWAEPVSNGIKLAVEDIQKEYVLNLGKEGKTLLVIATKKQARDIVSQIAKENEVLYVTNKWVAGLLTNFSEISKNIKKMRTLRKERDEGAWSKFVKHERIKLEKQLNKIASIYEGIEKLEKMPDALFIIDIKQDSNSVIEATRQNIPTIAVVDTNCNPHLVDFPIPANDDAVSSITFLAQEIIGAYVEGRSKVKKEEKAN
jgi:small subunit ribosomal protein S2